ncbi:MAG: AarF/ABC1/UbiB kinase family protein [Deltaproteobacteria bacterium]|nr:AarF/ABC1/UbiB kinase family protein [Deltaproteobacteria bacterium]
MSLREKAVQWKDAATNVPRLAYNAVRFGMAPAAPRALDTLQSEGVSDLHWKVLGDGLARFLQSSGPVLTKMGQILAARDDLLPAELCARLEKLYSRQPPMPRRQLDQALREAFPGGAPFESFESEPLGVGSIGQVHRARLRSGEEVIVKVIRPGIAREIERDMNAGRALVGLFGSAIALKALEDLAVGFRGEVDLRNEAASLEEFGRRFRKNPRVCVPKCYAELSSERVLVMEELKGEPLSELKRRAKDDREGARRAADLALKEILSQVFVEGRFHGDPHAGNLLVLPDGRLGLIDLGLTGEFSSKDRKNISRAVRAFLKRDPDSLIKALLGFGTVPDDFDLKAFSAEIAETVARGKAGVAAQVSGKGGGDALERFVNDLFRVAFRHRVYVPSSATLLIKTLVTIEGVARSLDPDVDLVAAAWPVLLKSLTPSWLRWISFRDSR